MIEHRAFAQQCIGYDKARIFKHVLWSSVSVAVCFLLAGLNYSVLKLFWIPLLVSFFFLVKFSRMLISATPITINDNGFEDSRSGYGFIKAGDITNVGRITAFNKRQLYLVVEDFAKYTNRLNPRQRKKAELNIRFGFSPIIFDFDWLSRTPDQVWAQCFEFFWPRWKGFPLPPDLAGEEIVGITRKRLIKGWANSKKAYRLLIEQRPGNQDPLVIAACKQDGRSCLVAVNKKRIGYAAKGLFTGPYLGGGDTNDVESMIITQEYGYCELKICFKTGIVNLTKIDANDAIEIAETIASIRKMQRKGNRWDA